ncbi:MAG: glutamate ABC transporter substrate-binding protein [Dehalococcoidia bacterium]|nr:glutamate ABC transporter substrate-binding protein [Dehalococcoidia bacterium]
MIALLAMAALVTACGDDDDDDTTPGGTTAATKPAAAPTFAADSTMGKIVAKGKLTVGVKFDQPGFGLKDPVTGKVDGFDVQMAKEIGHALGLKDDQIEFVEAVSANRIPFLQEDKVDLVIATMTINADRKTQIDFSRPYYLAGQSILVKKDNTTIKSVDDLNGKNVCSVQGSTSEKNVKAKAPQANLLSLTGYAACVDAMKSGRVEAVSTDDIILAGFAASDTSLKLVGGQFTQEPYGIGVKKGKTDFVQFIDALIAKELSDGTWDKIYDKYLGKVEGLPKAADARAKLPATN